jgi:hypothetical protein
MRLIAKDRRQKAGGRRQEEEGGRRQKEEGRRKKGQRLLPGCFSRPIGPNSPDYSDI